jgi:hypothetical protein
MAPGARERSHGEHAGRDQNGRTDERLGEDGDVGA